MTEDRQAAAENILDAGTQREKSQDSACLGGAGCLGGELGGIKRFPSTVFSF